MTDDYDLEDHEHDGHGHDADAGHAEEHAVVEEDHESKAESWQDDQPPVDDLLEDSATGSEETVSDGTQEEIVAPRRKSILLPTTIGVAGVLVLGAILHWQFGHAPSHIASALPKMAPAETVTNNAPPAPPVDTTTAPKTSLAAVTNAGAMPSASSGTAMPLAPMPSAPSAASAELPVPSGNPALAPAPVAAPLLPVMAAAPAPAPQPVPVAAAIPAAPAAPILVPAVVSAAPAVSAHETIPGLNHQEIDGRMATLSARIDELKKELDKATQQLAQAQSQNQPGVVLAANAPLEDRLTKVEQQVAQLEHKREAVPPVASSENTVLADAELAPAPAPVPAIKHKAAPASHKTKKAPAKHAARESSHWVLRAATPDEAWVAKDAATPELRHVKVGDSLPGIGRIKSIQQDGDNWFVVGSAGTIR